MMLKESISNRKLIETNSNKVVQQVNLICPICKTSKLIDIPHSIIKQSAQLTTISIPKDLICQHHFQAFIDKQFRVRGYQKVDFELFNGNHDKNNEFKDKSNLIKKDHDDLFDSLILEGNFIQYHPKNSSISIKKIRNLENKLVKNMTLKAIYEEFWDFIEEDNSEFRDLILKDKRRSNIKR